MVKKIGLIMALFGLFLLPMSAGAIPSLGVIDTDLLATVGGTTPVGMDGFLFPSDDGRITIWYGANSNNLDKEVPIFLATTAGGGFSFVPGGTLGGTVSAKQADGYELPYNTLSLGIVKGNSNWVAATPGTAPDLTAGKNMQFYLYSGVFSPDLPIGEWIFAMADANKNGLLFETGKDNFSPKTVSTTNVPEPATLLLLGGGLIGLWAFRKKFVK